MFDNTLKYNEKSSHHFTYLARKTNKIQPQSQHDNNTNWFFSPKKKNRGKRKIGIKINQKSISIIEKHLIVISYYVRWHQFDKRKLLLFCSVSNNPLFSNLINSILISLVRQIQQIRVRMYVEHLNLQSNWFGKKFSPISLIVCIDYELNNCMQLI
jgi:hypothetical protein